MFATRGNHHTAAMMAVAAVLTFVVLVVVGAPSFAEAGSIPPPHCNPDVSDALPPRLRRICAALYGIAEISNAVEQYLDDKSNASRLCLYASAHRAHAFHCPDT